jgi:hypothetical protein
VFAGGKLMTQISTSLAKISRAVCLATTRRSWKQLSVNLDSKDHLLFAQKNSTFHALVSFRFHAGIIVVSTTAMMTSLPIRR